MQLQKVDIPDKMSVIIRTAGIGKTKKEISKDLNFLISQWNKIREKTLKSVAPILIYEEGNLIKRTIRDLLTNDVNEVIIDGQYIGRLNGLKLDLDLKVESLLSYFFFISFL